MRTSDRSIQAGFPGNEMEKGSSFAAVPDAIFGNGSSVPNNRREPDGDSAAGVFYALDESIK